MFSQQHRFAYTLEFYCPIMDFIKWLSIFKIEQKCLLPIGRRWLMHVGINAKLRLNTIFSVNFRNEKKEEYSGYQHQQLATENYEFFSLLLLFHWKMVSLKINIIFHRHFGYLLPGPNFLLFSHELFSVFRFEAARVYLKWITLTLCMFFVLFVAGLDLLDFRVKSPLSLSLFLYLCLYLSFATCYFCRWVWAILQKGWNVILPSLIM